MVLDAIPAPMSTLTHWPLKSVLDSLAAYTCRTCACQSRAQQMPY